MYPGLACEKDVARSVGGVRTRESAGEKKHEEDETLGSEGESSTIRGRLRL